MDSISRNLAVNEIVPELKFEYVVLDFWDPVLDSVITSLHVSGE